MPLSELRLAFELSLDCVCVNISKLQGAQIMFVLVLLSMIFRQPPTTQHPLAMTCFKLNLPEMENVNRVKVYCASFMAKPEPKLLVGG